MSLVTEKQARGPGRPRSEAAHAAILDAVVPMIQKTGYDAFSIEGLAAHAGVGKATIYRRWACKEDLVVEALARFVAAIPTPDTGTLKGDLLAILTSDAALHSDPQTPALLSSLLAAMARSPRVAEAVRVGFVASRRGALATAIRRAVDRGEAAPDLDIDLAVQLTAGAFLYRRLVAGQEIDEGVVLRLVAMLTDGLRSRPTPHGGSR